MAGPQAQQKLDFYRNLNFRSDFPCQQQFRRGAAHVHPRRTHSGPWTPPRAPIRGQPQHPHLGLCLPGQDPSPHSLPVAGSCPRQQKQLQGTQVPPTALCVCGEFRQITDEMMSGRRITHVRVERQCFKPRWLRKLYRSRDQRMRIAQLNGRRLPIEGLIEANAS